MTVYKLTDIITSQETYVNPNSIEYYMYEEGFVQIETSSMYMRVSYLEFNNMRLLEGMNEHWNTQHTTA